MASTRLVVLTRYDAYKKFGILFNKGERYEIGEGDAQTLVDTGGFAYADLSDHHPKELLEEENIWDDEDGDEDPYSRSSTDSIGTMERVEEEGEADGEDKHGKYMHATQMSDGDFEVAREPWRKAANTLKDADLNGKRVLLKRQGAIGDVVFVAVFATWLKSKFPSVFISIAVRDNIVTFAEMFSSIDEAVSLTQAAKFDKVTDFDYIIQFNDVMEEQKVDDQDYYKLHFRRAGLDDVDVPEVFPVMGMQVEHAIENEADAILQRSGIGSDPFVCVSLGTSNPLKSIHVLGITKLINELTNPESGGQKFRVLCIGSNKDRIPAVENNPMVGLAMRQSLRVSAELVSRARVMFGCDTGFVQLAAATGVPTVSYWGPTKPDFSIRHAPGSKVTLQAAVHCSPCLHLRSAFCHYFQSGYPACMKEVDFELLARNIREVWKEYPKQLPVVNSVGPPTESIGPQDVLSPEKVADLVDPNKPQGVLLLDNSDVYTGGGFYAVSVANALCRALQAQIWIVCDSTDPVYRQDGDEAGVRWVHDPKLRNCEMDLTYTSCFDFVIGCPPSLGGLAITTAQFKNAISILLVYETPKYIALYRDGADAHEAYWNEYKAALNQCDFAFAISPVVKRSLQEWIPEIDARLVKPTIRDDVADSTVADAKLNMITLISRNMKYKELEVTISLLEELEPEMTEDDPLIIMVIGQNASALKKSFDAKWVNMNIMLETHDALSEAQKWMFLKLSKVVVHPSTFEGYGIPIAEAMYAGVPVIVKPLEVYKECFEDYPYYVAHDSNLLDTVRTLFGADSMSVEALQSHLNTAKKYASKSLGRYAIDQNIKKFASVPKVREILASVDRIKLSSSSIHNESITTKGSIFPQISDLRLAVISTWNMKCGIAETTKEWLEKSNCIYKVFAPPRNDEESIGDDDDRVVRNWEKTFGSHNDLIRDIVTFAPDVVHINHEFSFFRNEGMFFGFIKDLKARGIKVVITLHTYMPSGFADMITDVADATILTKQNDEIAVTEKLHYIPLPMPYHPRLGTDQAKVALSWTDRPRFVVGSFGLWNQHKGFAEFLNTFNDVALRATMDVRYMMMGWRNPRNMYATEVIREHMQLKESGQLALFTDFYPMDQVVTTLSAADVLVFNYSIQGHSSSSAAIRTGMLTGRPIVCTHSSMFSELEHGKHVLKVEFGQHMQLVDAIMRLYNSHELRKTLVNNCDTIVKECAADKVAQMHESLYCELVKQKEEVSVG